MEYSRWARSMPQPNPNPTTPNPLITDPLTHHHNYPIPYSSSSFSYFSQNPNPSSSIIPHEPSGYTAGALGSTLNPLGTDPLYSSYSHNPVGVYETYAHYQTVDVVGAAAAAAQPVSVQNWVVKELVHQYGGAAPQNGAEQLVPATTTPAMWTTPAVNPHGPWKKGPKKIKIVQSQFCEVCKITCNTKEVLDKHKTGRKHQRNLEKLKAAAAPTAAPSAVAAAPTAAASAVPKNPVIGPPEKPGNGNSVSGQKRIKIETAEDLETKKRKIMEGGAAASAVRSCGICNVVCNSETVFKFHLSGQKHIAMLKKLTSGTG